jgi:hypothetical protein
VFVCKRHAGEKITFEEAGNFGLGDVQFIAEDSDVKPDPTTASGDQSQPDAETPNGQPSNPSSSGPKKSKTSKPTSGSAS